MNVANFPLIVFVFMLSGCASVAVGTATTIGITAIDNQLHDVRRSAQRERLHLDGLELSAMPLNGTIHRSEQNFLICVGVGYYKDDLPDSARSFQIKPNQIKLNFSDGQTYQPSAYRVQPNRCPNIYDSAASYQALQLEKFTPLGSDSITLAHIQGTKAYSVLVLRFNQPPPDPAEQFKLYLGIITMDDKVYSLPPFEFSQCTTQYC